MIDLKKKIIAASLLCMGGTASDAWACSSCGCTLSTDWASQGFTAGPGFRLDFRFDYLDQKQLRSGTGTVDRAGLAVPNGQEIQQQTLNRNYTVALDYSAKTDWGVNVQAPYFDRYHTTFAPGDTEISTSHTQSIGDVRVIGRYHGFTADHSVGIQFGVKLPTGSIHNDFISGPQAGQPLDRGLQPGTGTMDILVGAYNFGALSRNWDYFVQGLLQQPLNSRDDFKPGTGINLNFGVGYAAYESVTPQLQINARVERRDSGANADIPNSGATLMYFSPGVTWHVSHQFHVATFVQLPIYQRVNGLQIEPRYTASVSVGYQF